MKPYRFIVVVLALFSQLAHGVTWTKSFDTSTASIANNTYATGLLTFGGKQITAIKSVQIANGTSARISVNCQNTTYSPVPSTSSAYNLPVAGSSSFSSPDSAGYGNACYLQYISGTYPVSGIIDIFVTGF